MMTMNEPERIDKLIQDTDAVIVALKDIDSKKYNEFKDRFDAAIETPEDGILTEEEQFNKIRRLLADLIADIIYRIPIVTEGNKVGRIGVSNFLNIRS